MIRQFVVDAFTDRLFEGNPAAVCILDYYPEDELMIQIARENRLSETAFLVRREEDWQIRWFAPGGEVDLCGHATLASAWTLFHFVEKEKNVIQFLSQSEKLTVKKRGTWIEMEFPHYELKEIPVTEIMEKAIGFRPVRAFLTRDLLCILENEEQVKKARIDLKTTEALPGMLLHISARSKDYDCVSRSFGPKIGIDEDPVCGSAHCSIIPYWSEVLGQDRLLAYQASHRGETLECEDHKDKVIIRGQAVLYAKSELNIDY